VRLRLCGGVGKKATPTGKAREATTTFQKPLSGLGVGGCIVVGGGTTIGLIRRFIFNLT